MVRNTIPDEKEQRGEGPSAVRQAKPAVRGRDFRLIFHRAGATTCSGAGRRMDKKYQAGVVPAIFVQFFFAFV